jgi:TonB family protein
MRALMPIVLAFLGIHPAFAQTLQTARQAEQSGGVPSEQLERAWLNPGPPEYTRAAYDAHAEGTVKVAFDLTFLGTTANIHILLSSGSDLLDKAAIKDVEHRFYRLSSSGDSAMASTGLTATITYHLADATLSPVPIKLPKPTCLISDKGYLIAGFYAAEFTINGDGKVAAPRVIASYPAGAFEAVALRALEQWRFKPAERSGVPVSSKRLVLFNFTGYDRDGGYPAASLKPGQWIRLEYTLTADGRMKDVIVVDRSDPNLSAQLALEQVRQMYFAPIYENGVAVEREHQFITVKQPLWPLQILDPVK